MSIHIPVYLPYWILYSQVEVEIGRGTEALSLGLLI